MSTSEFGYVVSTDATYTGAANQPLDVVQARVIASNVNHLADEFAQVRVTWSDATGITTPQVTANYPYLAMSFQFPVTLRQNGNTYKFRIRLGGSIAGGSTGKIYATISAPSASPSVTTLGGFADNLFITSTTTSATPAWLTGTSQGPAASADLVYAPAAIVSTEFYNTLDAIGGNTTGVEVPIMQLSVFGYSNSLTNKMIINGVYLAEYIGT